MSLNRYSKPLTENGLAQAIADVGKRTGLSGARVSPHTFRHSFARMYLDNSGDVYKLSRSLEHSETGAAEEHLKDFKSRDTHKKYDTYYPVNRLKQANKTGNKKSDGFLNSRLQRRCWRCNFRPFMVARSACEALASIGGFSGFDGL